MSTPRIVSADEALSVVTQGMTVASGSGSSEPLALLEALGRRAGEVSDIRLVSGMFLDGYAALGARLGNEIELRTWFMPGTLLGDVAWGPRVDFLPLTWVQTFRYMSATEPDVALIQVAPRDERGYYSVGFSASMNGLLVERAKVVIVQVNPNMPFTDWEATRVHESQVDFVVEDERPIRPFPHRIPDDRDRKIADYVASLIPDGATIQSGIGTIPETTLRQLVAEGRRDLLLTSQLTDAGRELIEAGCCVTSGPAAVVGEVNGSTELYKWVERNPRVEFRRGPETHGLAALADRRNFVSFNSTLEIDLLGQANSEILSTERGQAGGIGGSVDFMIGAMFDGARSILAIPSTTSSGKSRIVPLIDKGIVTIPRTLVQFVVTEYGIADLRAVSVRECAEALIAISHPDHRDQLRVSL